MEHGSMAETERKSVGNGTMLVLLFLGQCPEQKSHSNSSYEDEVSKKKKFDGIVASTHYRASWAVPALVFVWI